MSFAGKIRHKHPHPVFCTKETSCGCFLLGTIEGAAKLARTLGQQMEASPCAGLYAITADMDFEVHYGKRANKRRKMYNGMIPCQLYMYYSAPKFEHTAKPMPKSGFDGKRTTPNRFDKK